MHVRKTVAKVSAVALLPMVLSGCGVPIGLQVASWALDGISLLATEKSVSDHGISAIAQKDCAIWRVFKGESICRETAASIQLAEAAKFDDEDDNFEHTGFTVPSQNTSVQIASLDAIPFATPSTQADKIADDDPTDDEDDNFTHVVPASSLELAIIEMEVHQLATISTAAGGESQQKQKTALVKPMPLPGVKTRVKTRVATRIEAKKIQPQVSQDLNQRSILIADAEGGSGLISRPLPPPAPVKIEAIDPKKMKMRMIKRRSMRVTPVETIDKQDSAILRSVRAKPVSTEQPVNHEPIAIPETTKPVTSQKPKRAIQKRTIQKRVAPKPVKRAPVTRRVKATPGLYFVLGSFSVSKNADRMAKRAKRLSPKIVVAYPKGKRVHRVLVGPFAKSQKPRIRAKIRAADIRGIWILRMKPTARSAREQLAELPQ